MNSFADTDPYNLNRFISAQQGVYERVVSELTSGRKTSHWIWFIFPQINGLGFSLTARKYAIQSLDEARAYLENTLLAIRLKQCTQLVLDIDGKSINDILGYPDDLKFRSSMTLFAAASESGSVTSKVKDNIFQKALEKYFDSERDIRTLEILKASQC